MWLKNMLKLTLSGICYFSLDVRGITLYFFTTLGLCSSLCKICRNFYYFVLLLKGRVSVMDKFSPCISVSYDSVIKFDANSL